VLIFAVVFAISLWTVLAGWQEGSYPPYALDPAPSCQDDDAVCPLTVVNSC